MNPQERIAQRKKCDARRLRVKELVASRDSRNAEAREMKMLEHTKEANLLAADANTIARSQADSASRSARWAKKAAITAIISAIISVIMAASQKYEKIVSIVKSVILWFSK